MMKNQMNIIEETKQLEYKKQIIDHILHIEDILNSTQNNHRIYTYDEVFMVLLKGQKLLLEELINNK